MAKHIFVTGGVASSVGKGLTASSLGLLLRSRGLSVVMQKLDPYLNVDPGTMNPDEHGEVFVTEDGAETDLDLGHYERFTDNNLSGQSNATTGAVYSRVIERERQGDYLGNTVQVIPHITDEIKTRIKAVATAGVDVVITEVGGTVGDIEILPFLEAIRQFRNEAGRDNVCIMHLTLVPYIGPSAELKTKPTQHSVAELRSRGLQPDVIVCRSDRPISDGLKRKISDQCDVPIDGVVSAADAGHIYEIPLVLRDEGLDGYICRHMGISESDHPLDLADWEQTVGLAKSATKVVRVGLIVKYRMKDAYLSVVESLRHAGTFQDAQVELEWIWAEELGGLLTQERLKHLDGIVVPGGFGERAMEGKIAAIQYARENEVPCLGLCLGLQMMVVEFARNVAGLVGASSRELDPTSPYLVVDLMDAQRRVVDKGGTMRLGAQIAKLQAGSQVESMYGENVVSERHRHRLEVSPIYRKQIEDAGLSFSGTSPDGALVEFVELPGHPFLVGTQAHPEFKSRPQRPHPLFSGLIQAALARQDGMTVEELDLRAINA